MDDILVTATTLDRVLLETDEEEYDNTALQILAALRKTPLNDQAALVKVSIGFHQPAYLRPLISEHSFLTRSIQPSPRFHTSLFYNRW